MIELLGVTIPAIVGSSVLGSIASAIISKKKNKAEADHIVLESIFKWADIMRQRIDALESQVRALNEEISKLEIENIELRRQLLQLQPIHPIQTQDQD
jgi:predicted RNase H-like nuclease (RuvC/YqgF family)